MREVVRGDKHNLRKSANCNAQISVIHSAHYTDLCFAICRFEQGCICHLELHAHSPFLFPIVFCINLISFFNIIGSVLTVLCSGMHFFTWATARPQLSLFVALAWQRGFGVLLRAATSNLDLSLFHNPLSSRSVFHDGRKHKTFVFLQSNAVRE